MVRRVGLVAVLACALACAAPAAPRNWAAPQIRAVTQVGVLGDSVAGFAPQSRLTQGQLESAIATADAVLHPAVSAPTPTPVALTTSVGPDAIVAGTVDVEVDVTGRDVDHVDFAVDGTGVQTELLPPYALTLDTLGLADGSHALASD